MGLSGGLAANGGGLPASVETDIAAGGALPIDSTGVAGGQALIYDTASGHWKPGNVSNRQATDEGLLAESWWSPLTFLSGNSNRPSSGRIEAIKIPVPASFTSLGVWLQQNQGGGTLTAGDNFIGLYDSAGNRLAQTADLSATWTGTNDIASRVPWAASAAVVGGPTAYVYVAILSVGTTPVGVRGLSLSSTAPNTPQAAASKQCVVLGGLTGQTSLPATINLANNVSNNNWFWAGLG